MRFLTAKVFVLNMAVCAILQVYTCGAVSAAGRLDDALRVSSATVGVFALPDPDLRRLRALTDDTGMFEFADGLVPSRENGYCTEDVARALVAVLIYNRQAKPGDTAAAPLAKIYMNYLARAQKKDGDFYHRMDYKRHSSGQATEDSYGRALWGLGYAAAYPVDEASGVAAGGMFKKALPRARQLKWPRSIAYSMLGLHYYLARFPEDAGARTLMKTLADRLMVMYKKQSSNDWPWFEPILTYDNAKLPHALFLAYEDLKSAQYLDTAVKTLDFLIKVNFPQGNMLRIVGNKGWYPKGGKPALYDQQPTDAASMAEACATAYRVTGLAVYKDRALNSFEWFLGNNISGKPIYDAATGGSRDGLKESEINNNEGAESSIMFVIAHLTLLEIIPRQTGNDR
ncbi:MAG: hypothetical protein WCK75_07180 [Elusimicrobiota bacterium]